MTTKETLTRAVDRLIELGESPNGPLVYHLQMLVDAHDTVPSGEIELRAMVQPGGRHEVTDQHGRRVAGVKSVATFIDNGVPVFQVLL